MKPEKTTIIPERADVDETRQPGLSEESRSETVTSTIKTNKQKKNIPGVTLAIFYFIFRLFLAFLIRSIADSLADSLARQPSKCDITV